MTAESLAHRSHSGQVDKDGRPYIEHVERVRNAAIALVLQHSPDLDPATVGDVAWLHDVIEDTDLGPNELRAHSISEDVITAVVALTKVPGEPYLDLVARAANHPIARWVKIADNLDNSDEERLGKLDPEAAARLRAKYELARSVLCWP